MRVPSVVAGLLLLRAALAPPLLGQSGQIPYEAFTLPNGLRVLYSEDHSTPIVSVDVWYHTGSRNERPGRSGFAHLFEHMMFEGSAHVKKGEHFQLISRAGGSNNGSTAEDRTNYYETLPSNRLNLALWLEADRMRSLAITEENFHNQRETVKEERRLRVDNQPYSAAFVDGMTWPYDSTACFAYAHTVIGSMADLDAARLADVQAFFDTYYAPNNATLVVVGDFKPLELRRLVNQYFAGIPSHAGPPRAGRARRPRRRQPGRGRGAARHARAGPARQHPRERRDVGRADQGQEHRARRLHQHAGDDLGEGGGAAPLRHVPRVGRRDQHGPGALPRRHGGRHPPRGDDVSGSRERGGDRGEDGRTGGRPD